MEVNRADNSRYQRAIEKVRLPFAAMVCWWALAPTGAVFADDLEVDIAFNVPAQSLESALTSCAQQAKIQIIVPHDLVAGIASPGIAGTLTAEHALRQLLRSAGLTYKMTGANTVTVIRADRTQSPAPAPPPARTQAPASPDPSALTEIIVTAQKRSERLQDVPVPVTALSADTLSDSNQVRLQDYYASVPGLTVLPYDTNGTPTLAIRGITTGGFTNPTVSITVDDVPYGSSTGLGGGTPAPDIDPSDLARVEVLRGPQGTLYGASSIGGLLKYVTVDPSTEGFSGRVQADLNGIHNGEGLGYGFRAAANVPLSDSWAVRASGFFRQDPGYVDDVLTGQNGINKGNAYGGRLSSLWRPLDQLTVKVSALYQETKGDGSSAVYNTPGLGDLQQSTVFGSGAFDRKVQAYSATINAKLGIADLTSVTGYNVNTFSDSSDFTSILGPYTPAQFGVAGAVLYDDFRTSKVTQETRLSIPIGNRLDWLFGVFYTHEKSPNLQNILAEDSSTGHIAGSWVNFNFPVTYAEYAAFTDLTVHFTSRFDVQLGGRESHVRQTYSEVDSGPYVPAFEGVPDPAVFPRVVTNQSDFTYLVTPRFKVSPDLMVYVRLASGYRPGGPNATASLFGLPENFNSDKTQNYEIGVKGEIPKALSFDASIYYINWKDIQLQLANPTNGLTYYSNGSRAKSQGVELSVESKPFDGLTIDAWVAYNNAVLTQALPAASTAIGPEGDRLPFSSRFSSNLSLQQEFPVTTRVTGFAGGAVSYMSEREGVFPSIYAGPERQAFPAYAKVDVRSGVKFDTWTVNLFVNNATDRRAQLSGGLGSTFPFAFYVIQPRTVGLSIAKTY